MRLPLLALLSIAACAAPPSPAGGPVADRSTPAAASASGVESYATVQALCDALRPVFSGETAGLDRIAAPDVLSELAEWSPGMELYVKDQTCSFEPGGDVWIEVVVGERDGALYATSAAVRTSYDGVDMSGEAESEEGGFSVDYAAMTVQGTWRSTEDPLSTVEFSYGTFRERYDGEVLSERAVAFSPACPGLPADGDEFAFTLAADDPSRCYVVLEADGTRLSYGLVGGRGNTLSFTRVE